MDIVSHALIGRLIASHPRETKKRIWWSVGFSVLPDVFQIPLYVWLGALNHRRFYFPLSEDWQSVRTAHAVLVMLWEIPHSLLFWLIVVVPLVWYLKWPKIAAAAYVTHIFVDVFTHSGVWNVRPLAPFRPLEAGLADVWSWPWYGLLAAWCSILLLIVGAEWALRRKSVRSLFILP